MSEIKLDQERLKAQARRMDALKEKYDNLFAEVVSDLRGMNLNWSALLSNNFAGKINSVQKSFSAVTSMLEAGASAATQCAMTFESIDSVLSKSMLSDAEGAVNGAFKSGKSGIKKDIKDAVDVADWIDKNYENLSDAKKKILKDIAKKLFGNYEKGYEIINCFRKGEWGDGFEKSIDYVAGSSFNFEDSPKGSIKGMTVNWGAMKLKALGKTINMVLDEDGYISKNGDKYMEMMESYLLGGNVGGVFGAAAGDFVQTVGKGSVDILCQTASSSIDSITERAYGISLSTVNSIMYDVWGWSPGHAFNSVAKAINKGVDFVTDNVIIKGAGGIKNVMRGTPEALGNLTVQAVSATADGIEGAGRKIGDWINKIV